ncbi:hypothetical protein REPUB_Repub11eG0186900 [Reevesia pubescens]
MSFEEEENGCVEEENKISSLFSDIEKALKNLNFDDKNRAMVKIAIRHVYNGNNRSLSDEETSRFKSQMVVVDEDDEMVYLELMETMNDCIREMRTSMEAVPKGCCFLKELNRNWNIHCKALEALAIMLSPLNSYILTHCDESIPELGMDIWKYIGLFYYKTLERLQESLLEQVHIERIMSTTHESVDSGLMKNLIKMLVHNSFYEKVFEEPFLKDSSEFYRLESLKLVETCNSFADYIDEVERHCDLEIKRVNSYLDSKTKDKIVQVVMEEMVQKQILVLVSLFHARN